MTFAPPPLKALGAYLVAHGAVNLGIVGDQAHTVKGTSYHLGKDLLLVGAYSAILPRDKAGLSLAAAAIDIGKIDGSLEGLQKFSQWLVVQCMANDPSTRDIREVIFSPDGLAVKRWDNDGKVLYSGGTGTGQGDDSHRTHTHVSFWRDSEARDKVGIISPYFEESNMATVTRVVRQEWTAVDTDGVLRADANRALPVADRLPAGTLVESSAEATTPDGNEWRLTEWPKGSATPRWFLRTGPGVPRDHDFKAGAMVPGTPAAPADNAAYNAGVDAAITAAAKVRKP